MPGAPPRDREDTAIVVLGCPIVHGRGGALQGPLARRVQVGAIEASRREDLPVVVSGGRVWGDAVEADRMRDELRRLGVSPRRILAERCSHSTRENARYTSALLARRGVSDVLLVTCDWHAPRAAALFRREGFTVRVAAAPSPRVGWPVRLWRRARERLLLWAFAVVALAACKRPGDVTPQAPVEAGPAPDLATIARAEDRRRARDVPEAAGVSHDVRLRRRAAEALARIADADADAGLLRALEDEDPETVAWGAYGLGFSCRGKEEAHVKALAARAASLDVPVAVLDASSPRTSLEPRAAIARALGRCGGALAGQVLASWVRTSPSMAIPAAYGLGDVARASGLTDDAASALLDAATAAGPGDASLALLYPFGRVEHVTASAAPRVLEVARRALARPSELRSFAIRALSRVASGGADELGRVVVSHDFSATERAEAARGLALLGEPGLSAAAAALGRLAPEKDPFAIAALGGDEYGVLYALLSSLGGAAPKDALPALHTIASLTAPGAPPPALARRLSELRCLAAGALASGAYDLDVLQRCDLSPGSGVGERAKLAALVRRPLIGERRSLWSAMAKSPKVRLREDALEAIAGHAELGDAGRGALVEALASGLPGVVATAADVIAGHPDRVMALSAREIQRALDPASPPPTANPARELDRTVATALDRALSRVWSEDLVETRTGLLDAASAVRLPAAHAAAERACHDANAAVRDHAAKALRALGDGSASCVAPADAREAPDASPLAEAGPSAPSPVLQRATKVTFESDAGELAIVFEPELAPVAASRFVELARRGFYDGILVHRVVPGFVAQFGDPEGDGYGGSGALLRCETSPVPFHPLDVGVALSGRDTGSSQIFVTLGRYPHLDGEYARVGHAEGDWAAVAEGDVIRHARVSD